MSSKQALRKKVADKLRALDSDQLRSQGERCAQALRELAVYRRARSIAFYMHMERAELPTSQMIVNAFEDHKRVFLPHIVRYRSNECHDWFSSQRTHLRMLEMPSLAAVHALKPCGKLNLKEPMDGFNCLAAEPSSGEISGLDLIVLPGVAFTATGRRLGHGAGFYDSFIAEHLAVTGRTPTLLGMGLREQLEEWLPMESHDKLLDYVIIDGSTYEAVGN